MTTDSHFTAEVERLDRQRNRSLAWFLGCFLVWTLSALGGMVLVASPVRLTAWILGPLFSIPLLFWLLFLLRYLRIQSRIRSQPRLAEVLNDELVRTAWLKAAAAGFWAMLTAEILVSIWQFLVANVAIGFRLIPLNPVLLMDLRSPLVLAVGVIVTIGIYLYNRRD
jgi:hypothetical protein